MGSEAHSRRLLCALFDEAVAAAAPAGCVPSHLPEPVRGRTVVVGAGKAAASMAAAVEAHWPGELQGLVVTAQGHAVPTRHIEVVEAAHPVPDRSAPAAARRMLAMVRGFTPEDLVLCLISGGGSALLALPAEGLTLQDKRAVTQALLRSGAAIDEINCVRKHLSAIKGGRLAAAATPARTVTLAISDVPGDDPSVIASGPTVPDPTTFDDAVGVLKSYGVAAPPAVAAHLKAARDETPKPGDPRLSRAEYRLVATPQRALEAAAARARREGFTPLILSDSIEGEAREAGRLHAAIARQVARRGQPAEPPCVLLSGGETTVTLSGNGRGGRNTEFLLALALALDEEPGVYALACDTDGIDGSSDAAGAVATPDTLTRARAQGLSPEAHLGRHDAHGFFSALGDLVTTGPTHTNVNDFRAMLAVKGSPAVGATA